LRIHLPSQALDETRQIATTCPPTKECTLASPASNITEYTVSSISAALKRTVEDAYGHVRVRGEISGFRGVHSSGHAYFALKDDKARLEAVIWRTTMERIRFRPEEGLEVIATGKLSTFPGSSKYQLVIDALEPAGVGALMALLEERRKRLAAEGLFDVARKRKLPFLPRTIGVITSPTGAVIRDIIHRLQDRCPSRVLLWPVRVQGETAAEEIAAAIRGFDSLPVSGPLPRPDVLIVARGGGSLEDLWPFNEEIVVRSAAAASIPLISAVGHETDITLIDHVADMRAPTPTGAAEIAVPVRSELIVKTDSFISRCRAAMARAVETRRRELTGFARALPSPADVLANPSRSLDEIGARLGRSLGANALAHRARLDRTAAGLSPLGLGRLVSQATGRIEAAGARMMQALAVHSERKRSALALRTKRFRPDALAERISAASARIAELDHRQRRGLRQQLQSAWQKLEALDKLLDAFSLSKESVLARGYALVHAGGKVIGKASEVPVGGALELEFSDGRVSAIAGTGAMMPKRPRRRTKAPDPGQGSLFDPDDE
jgi:exodeoxyribonuclease VII large subunit